MELIQANDVVKAARLKKVGNKNTARFLMQILKLNKVNRLYERHQDKVGVAFIDAVLHDLGICFEINSDWNQRIPNKGGFIMIANHPFGGLEGMILLSQLSKVRPDIKIMGNFLFHRIMPVKDFVLAVNPFETHRNVKSSIGGMKEAITYVQAGNALIVFPAGEVSTYQTGNSIITDRKWPVSIVKFLKKANVPIIPAHFSGSNSMMFHLLGFIHPLLRTAKIPSEIFNKKHKLIKIRIGTLITAKDQEAFTSISRYYRYLRARVYSLKSDTEPTNFFTPNKRRLQKPEPIEKPSLSEKLLIEVKACQRKHHLFDVGTFSVFCVPSIDVPCIMREIGRLREITFREVGEGTNRKTDIDEFDLYYHQLFIWDRAEKRIVGGYRIGWGNEIVQFFGIKGFYIRSLFKIKKGMKPVLKESIELGRSFIVPDYQRKPISLFLLWKGILYILLKNPEYRYLIGPVSISNRYSEVSKTLMIQHISRHYYDRKLAKFIKPKKSFRVSLNHAETEILMDSSNDLGRLDKLIHDIEVNNFRMPVLLKKYLQLNAKIVGFNIDPKFNNSLDGLMVLDVYNVPAQIITSLSKEFKDEKLMERFSNSLEMEKQKN